MGAAEVAVPSVRRAAPRWPIGFLVVYALCIPSVRQSGFETADLSTLFELSQGPDGLQRAVTALCQKAAEAVRAGKKILILSDRSNKTGNVSLSEDYTYIPPLLAIGAVHHHLIRQGLRMKTSLIADTAQCWSTHHFACLIGYGASAVCPLPGAGNRAAVVE